MERKHSLKRYLLASLVIVLVLGIAAYASGRLTVETRSEEACALCRATRYSGRHYGFPYERIEENVFTQWYRSAIDPKHGLEDGHRHIWVQSGCTMSRGIGLARPDYQCVEVQPLFLLRPEVELEVIQQIPDVTTQVAVIRSLNSSDRKANEARVRLMIEYYYIDRSRWTWDRWWQVHAQVFGLTPLPQTARQH